VGGSVTIATGQTLTLLGGGLSDPLTVQSGGVLLIHGAVALSGALTLPTGSVLRMQGDGTGGTAALTVATGFTNSGTIELTNNSGGFAASLTVSSGTLTNAAGGLINSIASTGGNRTLAAQLDNQGDVTVNQSLLATGALDQRNTLSVPAGRTLTVNGPLQLFPGSVTTVNGTLVKTGGCTNLGGTITGGGTGATCP
jgi:hypothetical protein